MKRTAHVAAFLIGAALMLGLLSLAGCPEKAIGPTGEPGAESAATQPAEPLLSVGEAKAAFEHFKEQAADLRERATTMPAGADRDQVVAMATAAENSATTVLDWIKANEQGINDAAGGDAAAGVGVAAGAIGAVVGGPYGALIAGVGVGLAGLIRAAQQKREKRKLAAAATRVVRGLDAGKDDLGTIQTKDILVSKQIDAIQGPEGKALVDAAQKGTLVRPQWLPF